MQKFCRKATSWMIAAAVLLSVSVGTAAAVDSLVPVGRAAGIKLHAQGVLVVTVDSVQTADGAVSPGSAAGLQAGDLLLSIDGKTLAGNDDLQNAVAAAEGKPVTLAVQRDGQTLTMTAQPVQDSTGAWRLGLTVRDGVAGIGTITYVDPETGAYGSLGHGICDFDSGVLVPLEEGSLMEASVAGVNRGEAGAPGALQGAFDLTRDMGTVEKNTESGIFGVLTDDSYYAGLESVPVAQPDEVHTGACEILSNVEGETVARYDAEIVKVFGEGGEFDRCMVIHVTDPDLLARTGGIVQGMSGSPVLQDGKLIGAVTHVLVNDPTRGYAIRIDRMTEEMEN